MLLGAMLAIVPASAADVESMPINLAHLDYIIRDWKGAPKLTQEDFENLITVTVKDNMLATEATANNDPGNPNGGASDQFATAYLAQMYPITEDTSCTITVKAKNNRLGGYTGLIFASDAEGKPYFIYGALNNYGDHDKEKSDLRARYAYHNKDSNLGSWLSDTDFRQPQTLDADGFASYKIVYEGFKATLYTIVNNEWTQITFGSGMTYFTLAPGSYISLGIYSRHGNGTKQRTATLLNPTIESDDIRGLYNGKIEAALAKVFMLVPEAYTADSYKLVTDAVTAVEALGETATYEEIDAAVDDIYKALEKLEIVKYAVSFDANGGSGTMDAIPEVNGGTYELPKCGFTAPEGKFFAGWATAPDGEVIYGDAILVADTKYYAIWEFITYSVSFNSNGGSGKMFNVSDLLGEYTLPECTLTPPAGKEFKGWALTKDGDLLGETYNITENTTLYAIWGDPAFAVNFDANGGTGEMAAAEAVGEYTIPECTFTAPEGKKFKGWATTADGATLVDKVNVTADMTIFAIWEELPPAPTDAPTEKPTEAPKATEASKSGGCGGSIAIGAAATVAVLGTALVLKKKEN